MSDVAANAIGVKSYRFMSSDHYYRSRIMGFIFGERCKQAAEVGRCGWWAGDPAITFDVNILVFR